MKKALLVFAHPIDESFLCGGTIAKYKKEGWNIRLILVTNGGRRESSFDVSEGMALGEIRRGEAKKAAYELGIKDVVFLEKEEGTLKDITPGTLEDLIHEQIEEFFPDVVITFDTTGVNNDPDHIKVCYATTFAFQKYAFDLERKNHPERFIKGRAKLWKKEQYSRMFHETSFPREPKLYYACIPERDILYLQRKEEIPETSWDLPWRGTQDKFITTVIDVQEEKLEKGKALLCYETHADIVDRYISFPTNPLVDREYYKLRMQGIYEVFMGKTDRVSDEL